MHWHQLVAELEGSTWKTIPQVIEGAWSTLVESLSQERELVVPDPHFRPWFHVRRRLLLASDKLKIDAIQVLRLRDAERLHLQHQLTQAVVKVPGVASAEWCSMPLDCPDERCFFSFLQKLSFLRVIGRVSVASELGQTPDRNYGNYPYCRATYSEIKAPGRPRSSELAPWSQVMEDSRMHPDLTHEYAHWFGHIMSAPRKQ